MTPNLTSPDLTSPDPIRILTKAVPFESKAIANDFHFHLAFENDNDSPLLVKWKQGYGTACHPFGNR
jgi:hypothetical protein